jgi:hypothetical protein
MKNEVVALAFDRWYRIMLQYVVLQQFSDSLLESDTRRKEDHISSIARFRNRCKVWCSSQSFQVGMMFAIVFSILLMLVEHDYSSRFGQLWGNVEEYMTFNAAVVLGQIACAGIFTIDLGLKLIGQGPLTFARHLLNWIDVVVVDGIVDVSNLISVYTCYSTESENPYACEGASLFIPLLRGLRLVRPAKLLRFFPNLRCVMIHTHTHTHTHTYVLSW